MTECYRECYSEKIIVSRDTSWLVRGDREKIGESNGGGLEAVL